MHEETTGDLARFSAKLPVRIRTCTEADLPVLEWDPALTHRRGVVADAYERQRRGECLVLVADVGGWPVGLAWIDLARKAAEATGVVWAVRVVPALQGVGIGTRLVETAERVLARMGFAVAELGVETSNPMAHRLYERLGYRVVGRVRETYACAPPGEAREEVSVEEWVMQKALRPEDRGAAEARQ